MHQKVSCLPEYKCEASTYTIHWKIKANALSIQRATHENRSLIRVQFFSWLRAHRSIYLCFKGYMHKDTYSSLLMYTFMYNVHVYIVICFSVHRHVLTRPYTKWTFTQIHFIYKLHSLYNILCSSSFLRSWVPWTFKDFKF